jgi:hypothetical protein
MTFKVTDEGHRFLQKQRQQQQEDEIVENA